MPSFSQLRKRASASFDAYTASAAGPPPTRAQRALSRLSRLRLPLRSSQSQADFSQPQHPHRAPTPSSSTTFGARPDTPSPFSPRPNKLRRQSRSLSVSTALAFSTLPGGDSEREREKEQNGERLKRTISYPLLVHASSPVDAIEEHPHGGGWWGVRQATERLDQRRRSKTASSLGAFKVAFPVSPSPSPTLGRKTPRPHFHARSVSQPLEAFPTFGGGGGGVIGDSSFSSSSSASMSDYSQPDVFSEPTSRFSTSTIASTSPVWPSTPARAPFGSPAPGGEWRESDASNATVDLDCEFDFFPSSSPPSPVLYKNQPLVCSTPLTPTSPRSPSSTATTRFPSLSSKPSFVSLSTLRDVDTDGDTTSSSGFSFARTSPARPSRRPSARTVQPLPTPPATPRLEPVMEDEPSFLALPEAAAAEQLREHSEFSVFLDELQRELEEVQEGEMEKEQQRPTTAHRSSIPFPVFDLSSLPPSPSPSPVFERTRPSSGLLPFPGLPGGEDNLLPARPDTPDPFAFPHAAETTSSTPPESPTSFRPLLLASQLVQQQQHKRERVLRRVTSRLDLPTLSPSSSFSSASSVEMEPPSPSPFSARGAELPLLLNEPSPISSTAATPTPATPRNAFAFPRYGDDAPASPKRAGWLGVADEDMEAGQEKVVEEQKEQPWTTFLGGVEGARRRSF
ncbi:hypothetical protein JCM8097_001096 [Rhodosporidiobolus ruineniae]